MERVFDANVQQIVGMLRSQLTHSMPVEAHSSKDFLNIFLG